MCGIAGAVNWGDREIVGSMARSVAHRGPDDEGVWDQRYPDGTWVGLGHRRLSIQDLSPAGHQPMSSEDGRFWIVFNGEIYNFQGLRRDLIEEGHSFRSRSDTEVILRLYAKLGEGCLERLRGRSRSGSGTVSGESCFWRGTGWA